MSEDVLSFGRQAASTMAPGELLALECAAARAEWFAPLDQLVGGILQRALRGERIVTVERGRQDTVTLRDLESAERALLDEHFSLERQQARGAWFLPEEATLRVGALNLPSYLKEYPRYAMGTALEERAKVRLHDSADAVLIWALLQPLFERLLQPLELRGPLTGLKSRDEQIAAWAKVDQFLHDLDLDVAAELTVMRYGGGWGRLSSAEQIEAKQRLIGAVARQVSAMTASRYRAGLLQTLIGQYYNKAKKRPPTRRQVVSNRPLQRILAAYFGGDWLAFLAYINEAPHQDERIATVLPAARLQVGGGSRAATVASELGLPLDEVERMVAAYWDRPVAASPLEERVAALRRYWQVLDDLYTRQATGMQPLWGLVEDQPYFTLADDITAAIPFRHGLYRDLLPAELLADIERLWGVTMLPRWPERIVTEPAPHIALAQTVGPALKFWHGCALTTWFICEGPSSRTDLAGIAHYYRLEVAQLAELGCPVDGSLFADLLRAERHLGPPEAIISHTSTAESASGIAYTVETSAGERRRGFEGLRDIVSRHRRAWTAEHLETYLRARSEGELHAVGREYNRLIEDRGKPPTPRQFARQAVATTNHWFGGDIRALYGALGEKVNLQPERKTLVPADRDAFAWAVFRELGGTPLGGAENTQSGAYSNVKRLAERSLWYIQLKEALDRPPELKEFGRNAFEWVATSLASNIDEAWERYRRAIEAVLRNPPRARFSARPASAVRRRVVQPAASTRVEPVQPMEFLPPNLTEQTFAAPGSAGGEPLVEPSDSVASDSAISPEAQPRFVHESESGRSWWKRLLRR